MAWNKLIVPSFPKTPRVIVWDVDGVPLPWAPPSRLVLNRDYRGMLRIVPSATGRIKLRRKYGRKTGEQLWFNSGLISVSHPWKSTRRKLFLAADFNDSVFREPGALHHHAHTHTHGIHVEEVDGR